jgi:hypothetical protein
MDKQLKLKLIRTREAVKRKFDALKSNRLQSEQILEESYKPLTKKLTQLITAKPEFVTKEEILPKMKVETPAHSSFVEKDHGVFNPDISTVNRSARMPAFLEDDEVFTSDAAPPPPPPPEEQSYEIPTRITDASISLYAEQFGPLPKQYIEEYIRDTEGAFDDGIQGIRHDVELDKFFIGNSEIKFNQDNDDFEINNIKYKGSEGLYELLFKKKPRGFNEDDKKQYAHIIERTSAAKVDHNPDGKIAGNRSGKYKIIGPLLAKKPSSLSSYRSRITGLPTRLRSGTGIMSYNVNPIEYVHYDDPNELVDRLKLLLASQQAGNNSHNNEIQSIIEELREAKIIL